MSGKVRVVGGFFVDATAALDDFLRGEVVFVAEDEDGVDGEIGTEGERLAEHLGGVAAIAVGGDNGIADVAAEAAEEIVETVAEGKPTDHLPFDHGYVKRIGDKVAVEIDALRPIVGFLYVGCEFFLRVEMECEFERR